MARRKRSIPFPTSRRKVAQSAIMLALTVLQDERVRSQLRRAPGAARQWALQRRSEAERGTRPLRRLDPMQRFGQRGIERRLTALQRNVRLAFPDPAGPDALAVYRAIDELDRAASISATMPLVKRRRAHLRIGRELARLETALVDAVLPPADTGT